MRSVAAWENAGAAMAKNERVSSVGCGVALRNKKTFFPACASSGCR
jgi:hypothetical protein